ncbi:hypothetical protein ACJJTC_006541 [Scirpophaga incertulas]
MCQAALRYVSGVSASAVVPMSQPLSERPVPPPRFKKLARLAAAKERRSVTWGPETWVGVRALRASSGGILDPDDRVRDVADDRETLTAECGGQAPQPRAAQADGASGSSAGTASPDMFRGGGGVGGSMRVPNTDSCVEVGEADLEDGAAGLQVRRGSEPTLHQDTMPSQISATEQTKRWSAAVVCREDARGTKGPPPEPERLSALHFQRQTNRLSMQFSGPGSGMWLDAAERVQSFGSKSLPRDARREPLGQDTPPSDHRNHNHRVEDMLRWVSGVNNVASVPPVQERPLDLLPEVGSSERAISGLEQPVGHKPSVGVQNVTVALVKGEKGLGFTITTRDNPTGGHCPIYIKTILPKGAAVTDGRLRAGDRLVSVNNVSVSGLTQQQVVSLLRNTPTDSTVEIVVERPAPNRTQRVEPQKSSGKYVEKAIGPTSVGIEVKPENGHVSTIVNAINQGGANSSLRGRIPKSSSKDDLLKDHSLENGVQDMLNSSSNSILSLRNRLILRLEVPVHDSEKAGLGISVKGKVTVGSDPQDLGIFIKSVLHGESMDSLARWKDDTPPNGNDTNTSTENNFNTVIYNSNSIDKENSDYSQKDSFGNHDNRGSKKHASIVTINNNNSWVSNQSDDSKGYLERDKEIPHDNKRDSFEWSRLDGWNPVIDRLTGLRNESYYMATGQEAPVTNGHHYRPNVHVHMSRSPPAHHNVIIEEDYGATTRNSVGGGGESGSESGAGFSRDAIGRRSMSEKRHAALDAKQTGTYKKIKEIKAVNSLQVGPALGMRKSSSLESLQTAIQENQRHPRTEPIYARAHPPLKHWLTDDHNGPEGIVRGSPQQSSLSHKKPSLLKSLSTMFRIGKPHKKPEGEIYGRTQPGRSSEKSLSRDAVERHNRIDERTEDNIPSQRQWIAHGVQPDTTLIMMKFSRI